MSATIVDWHSHCDEDGILWLILDKKDTDTNVLSASVLEQLDSLIDQLSANPPRAIVFRSGKTRGFIAGADINEFLEVSSTQEALIMIKRGRPCSAASKHCPARPSH
jgi:3-hydroxyacyl-CoA dehydrogenase/enoyl-CoA hydratase/3-hydroxybutyryl-CoA epimerase